MTQSRSDTAARLRQLLIESSPLIEEYTRELCPGCTDVCCKQKHGVYRDRDVTYLSALGMAIPEHDPARSLEGPCEALGEGGCIHPRWLRPFKCTWYFCEPIILALRDRPQRSARAVTAVMEEMIRLYDKLGG